MADPLPIAIVLDVAQVADDEITRLLPVRPTMLRLSDETGRRPMPPGGMKGPYDWNALGRAVESLGEKARRAAGDRGLFYVAGRAPLPLFVQLGHSLAKFAGEAWMVNPYRGGSWMLYPMSADPFAKGKPFFDEVSDLRTRNVASGLVVVYVSTLGAPAPEEAFLETLQRSKRQLAGIVEIRTLEPGDVTPKNAGRLTNELIRELPRIKDAYPRAEGIALFVAGPAPLAFAVGRAVNFHAQRDIWIMNYDRGGDGGEPGYEVAITLPFRASSRVLGDAAEDQLARRGALAVMIEGIDELRATLKRDDFPEDAVNVSGRYLAFLKDLRYPREPQGDAFALGITNRELTLGRGLLEAVRGADPTRLAHFAQLLLLHELYHDGQDLRSSNYAEIGRAGVVLEEVDFWADAFALATLVRWDLRQGGPRAEARVAEITMGWIDDAIFGLEAFDKLESPREIERLYERRLRRYLIWHLQHERARTVRGATDVDDLFRDRLFVELAPLEGRLDARGDKLVNRATPGRTEVFAARKGHLVRRGPGQAFDPALLVDAVRRFDRVGARKVFRILVEEHRSVLVPWVV